MANDDGYYGMEPGAIIRLRRERLGWTQRELAEKVGHIDAAGVSKIETGVTKLGRERASRFARSLDLPVSLLLPVPDIQPSPRELLDHLESLEDALSSLAERVAANQGLVATALERITALLLRRDERELSKSDPLPLGPQHPRATDR